MFYFIDVVLILFIVVCAIAAVRVRELVSATFILSAFSFLLAILWSLLGAPDVSFTEVVVGAGASTIFFLLALFGSKHFVAIQKKPSPLNGLALVIIFAVAAFLLWGSSELPALGDLQAPAQQYLSPFYIQNPYEHMKTPNMVTAIVVDYRGFDTLIETAVIFTAGVACLLIFRHKESS